MGVEMAILAGVVAAAAGAVAPAPREGLMKAKVVRPGAGTFRSTQAPLFLVGRSLWQVKSPVYRLLQERMQQRWPDLQPERMPPRVLPGRPLVLAGLVADHPALGRLASRVKADLPPAGLGDEGYLIEVTPRQILIAATKPAGIFYAAQRLAEMAGDAWELPALRMADWPAMQRRGLCLGLFSRDSIPAVVRILEEHAPRYRVNSVILQIDYHFQFRSHPEVAEPDALSVDDCRRLAEVARRHCVELVPMINCLGHQSWGEATAQLLKAHPEFDETPDLDPKTPGFYCRSWCPSHPDLNPLLFDLFDEVAEAFQSRAFHVGMDEVFILGQCPRCRGQDNARLFARAVNDYHRHLVGRRGLEMQMWGDRLLDNATMRYGEWESSTNGTAAAIDLIPKDIVLCDWHYQKQTDFPSVRYLQEKGFRVWPAGWDSAENARNLARCALRHQSERMLGYLATTWTSPDTIARGLAGDAAALASGQNTRGIIAGITTGLQVAWEGAE